MGLVGGDVPDDCGPYSRSAFEIHGRRPDRVRLRFGLVRVAAMADRGAVAIPDPRGDARKVRLSRAHRNRQAEDLRIEFGPPLWNQDRGNGRLQGDTQGLRSADDRRAEIRARVWTVAGRQPGPHARNLLGAGDRAGTYPVWMDAGDVLKKPVAAQHQIPARDPK